MEAEAVRIANDTPYGLTDYANSKMAPNATGWRWRWKAGMVQTNGRLRGRGAFSGCQILGRAREGGVWGGAGRVPLESKAILGRDVTQTLAAE
jgi:aldehyde dehydrogenase (NAD+)